MIFEIYTYNCRVSCLITCILAVSFDFVLLCCGLVLTACHVLIVSVVVSPPSLFPCSLAHLLSHRVLVYLLLIVPLCFAVFCQTVVLTASIVIVTAPLCALSYPWALSQHSASGPLQTHQWIILPLARINMLPSWPHLHCHGRSFCQPVLPTRVVGDSSFSRTIQ